MALSVELGKLVRGVNSGEEVGESGVMRMWDDGVEALRFSCVTWRGAMKGLNVGLCRCWVSAAMASAGSRNGEGGGEDSCSRNLTNSWEKDCNRQREKERFKVFF